MTPLLEVSRVESGALRPARVPVPVEELCRAAVDDARLSLGDHLVEIEMDVADGTTPHIRRADGSPYSLRSSP